ncbi:hypothetical protein NSIN_20118 [Nitrosotalea sinensis]|uniref:Uncharacterized protein n=1 Tax=Nitrosotalea sinensis TaxID=1499975 RepID=A0A2H1EEZ4_9ARCH|nr:hypothetical protein NSIN_20118 [Candidatus Nitrosotalea sinensis]
MFGKKDQKGKKSIEKKHANNFWHIVERKLEDHEKREMELFGYWFLIQNSINNGGIKIVRS